MSDGSVHVRGVQDPREMCWRCRRPARVCYCAAVRPIATRSPVVILQHPRESDVPINTARIAALCLSSATLHVGLDFATDRPLQVALSNADAPPVLLFPAPDAKDLAREPPPGPVTLVVIDGTWWQASKLFKLNPFLWALPRYSLAPAKESRYRIRREPAAHCLSTIEALAAALGVLEGRADGLPELLEPFEAMVETQLEFVARENRPRHRRSVVARDRPLVLPILSQRPESLVVGYGEANAWPHGALGARAPEVVHWAAVRPFTGERFEAYVAPSGPLAPSFELHSQLVADRIHAGESRAEFARRLSAFLRPDDVLATWGFYAPELLRAEGIAVPPCLDLREAAIHTLGRRVGQLDDYVAALGARPCDVWATGRTGARLASMEALVERLRGARRDDLRVRRTTARVESLE
ncbi:MAG TPA: tRNA-uridine aminocarboxypropyltransferase [Polyangiaceae bacterium]|jgi:DTW domain-containing protein YfiP|nr:tRNA-uridine aminocarboxypropyltransferase [Polyangiaceae bacterium]